MAFTDQQSSGPVADAAEIIARYPKPRSALLPLLHLVQAAEGFVAADGIEFCAGQLGLSEAEVTAVVSFYTMYKRHPVGEYHVGVCTNTLCAVMGGDQILAGLREHLGVGDDVKALPRGTEQLVQLPGREHAGRAASQVDGIHAALERAAQDGRRFGRASPWRSSSPRWRSRWSRGCPG